MVSDATTRRPLDGRRILLGITGSIVGDPEEIKKLMEAVADQGKTTPDGRK